ncbi:formimidoylglutamase [Aneurinibacillus migulanus]|uniref:formimidoylglutamase n=1 Tax=Aneurinibacillus migulanus TaxID=47500 RepID=UPI002E1A4685|nr:formimidoylglutamase [Aneurinibacillus migulanus]MED4729782.1 formimidoylglutamase [Aneurinibacillus migulanus]
MYTVTDEKCWAGRIDSKTEIDMFRLHQVVRIEDLSSIEGKHSGTAIGLIGFRCDEGVSRNKGRIGAYKAPDAIRKALASLPWHFGESVVLYDFGNISCDDKELETAQDELGEAVKKMLDVSIFPIIIGGGHEVAYGHYVGEKRHLENRKSIGILNFDAHFDMRPYDQTVSSGTMFRQIGDELAAENKPFRYMCVGIQRSGNTKHLFATAEQYGCEYICEDEIYSSGPEHVIERIRAFIDANEAVMLTLCSDVLDASWAPGVSAPQPFGLEPKMLRRLLKEAIRSEKVTSFDIAEINPELDEDGRTVKLAASLLYEVIESLYQREKE